MIAQTLVNAEPPKPQKQTGIVVGLDLGQAGDPTALCLMHRTRIPHGEAQYQVSDLRRYKLGTSYVKIVDHIKSVMEGDLHSQGTLVIDQSGVGRAVYDMMRAKSLSPIGITITGAGAVTMAGSGNEWRVPKVDLISAMQVLLQNGQLRFASALKAKAALIAEMRDFRVKVTDAANETFSARSGRHDDLILAVAIACYAGEYLVTPQIFV